ncbi:FKBP-type peptidyl-prolyl cis-trans isomerase [Saccharicrinis aurantiacus]|uniref:FKBP-type peptidyl-prolyl cis-trans isomerase n=1 Tax=Saccharicrinis aurantiacus TaxID=1849719 RepID=UPI002493C46E|nr:FKBP-type peptidyl-prolyl cis-trans isomerase [Saccharicrinis aurantiacus]
MSKTRKISPNEEAEQTMVAMQTALKAKMKALKNFAQDKLEAFEESEELEMGVRIYKESNNYGTKLPNGQTVKVSYQGYLPNGRKIDSGNIVFSIGQKDMIAGFSIGAQALQQGEEATIFIPSSAAYGKSGSGKDIKPYTTLIFDMTLKDIL